MILVVDSREQRPLEFTCECVRKKLTCGDYGAEFGGKLHAVVFERKGIGDLFGTMTFGYDRFRRQIDRAAKNGIIMIIAIEGTKEKVLRGYSHSARDPESIIKQLETIERKYGVKHIFFGNRAVMSREIEKFFRNEYERYLDVRQPNV